MDLPERDKALLRRIERNQNLIDSFRPENDDDFSEVMVPATELIRVQKERNVARNKLSDQKVLNEILKDSIKGILKKNNEMERWYVELRSENLKNLVGKLSAEFDCFCYKVLAGCLCVFIIMAAFLI